MFRAAMTACQSSFGAVESIRGAQICGPGKHSWQLAAQSAVVVQDFWMQVELSDATVVVVVCALVQHAAMERQSSHVVDMVRLAGLVGVTVWRGGVLELGTGSATSNTRQGRPEVDGIF